MLTVTGTSRTAFIASEAIRNLRGGDASVSHYSYLSHPIEDVDIPNMHFLPKPFSVAQIGEAVEGVLRGSGN